MAALARARTSIKCAFKVRVYFQEYLQLVRLVAFTSMADADATDERLARAWCLPCNCLHTVAQHDIVYTCEVGGGGTCCRYAQVLNVDKHRVRLRYWRIDLTTRPDDQVLGQGTCLTMAPSPIGEWSRCFDVRVEQLACIMLHVAHRVTTSLECTTSR